MINKEVVMMNGGFAIFTTEELIDEIYRRILANPIHHTQTLPNGQTIDWVKTITIIERPLCPRCRRPASEETNLEARSIWSWYCDHCKKPVI